MCFSKFSPGVTRVFFQLPAPPSCKPVLQLEGVVTVWAAFFFVKLLKHADVWASHTSVPRILAVFVSTAPFACEVVVVRLAAVPSFE